MPLLLYNIYHIAGKFGEFGESSVIRQTKTIQFLLVIITLWLNLCIRQTFPHQTLITSEFAKLSRYSYGIKYKADISHTYVRMYVATAIILAMHVDIHVVIYDSCNKYT